MFIERKNITPEFARRSFLVANMIMIPLIMGIFFVYWNIQVLHNEYYQNLSLRNIIKIVDLMPPRGIILDRHGHVLAENTLNFTLFLIRENIQKLAKTIRMAAFLAETGEDRIREILRNYEKYPKFYMIPIKTNLPMARVAYVESRVDEYPEFKIEIEPQRTYPNGSTAAHLLGYISEITENELRNRNDNKYRMGDLVGITGIERIYNEALRGKKGNRKFIKDSREQMQQIVSEENPQIGSTLVLTIDLELQKLSESLLGQERGAIGVVDLQSGGILALASKPDYNPEWFTRSLNVEQWNSLVNAPEKPLQNKFTQGIYSPGSVFKIVMALAALQEKVIDSHSTFFCSGAANIYNRPFHCWKPGGHGYVNVYSALEKSCNIFFYNLGMRLDINTIARYTRMLGLGEIGLIDLPNETAGIIPTTEWKEKTFGQKWFGGETISVAIGEGSLSVTPLQILRMVSTVALRGKAIRFHIIDHLQNGQKTLFQSLPSSTEVGIDKVHFETVIEGLFRVVNGEGTAGLARIPGLDICGKTGTSQIISKENPHYNQLIKKKEFVPNSWFVSFAPRDNPRIAVVVIIENGGDAGRIAAPIAAQIYRKYFSDEGLL